jgi:hypothetical protein
MELRMKVANEPTFNELASQVYYMIVIWLDLTPIVLIFLCFARTVAVDMKNSVS